MKKLFRTATVLLAATMLLSIACFAGDFTALADELHDMKMFLGTDAGYELDKVPTRAQAAVMLVRLLGQEEYAKGAYASAAITNPFVDAAVDWAAPSIAYLYSNGLTNGMGKNEHGEPVFGMYSDCSAQMYSTFLLRALGYKDTGDQPDFSYAGAVDFAKGKGVADDLLLNETFSRDTVVAASYQALSLPVKDGSGMLLEKLISSGAIDAAAAADSLAKMKAYRKIADATQTMNGLSAADFTINIAATLGDPLNTNYSLVTDMQYTGGEKTQYAMLFTIDSSGQKMQGGQWYKDGWTYTLDFYGNATKMKSDSTTDSLQETLSAAETGSDALYMFDGWTSRTENGMTCYSFNLASGFFDAVQQQAGEQLSGLGMQYTINKATLEYWLNGNGALVSSVVTVDMTLTTDNVSIPAQSIVKLTVNATGDKVVVEYPDLSKFVETAQ